MDSEEYQRIRRFVKSRMARHLYDRHLDDCTQYIAIEIFKRQGKPTRWDWKYYDYCMSVGLSKYASDKQITRETKTYSFDKPIEGDENTNSEYLMYEKAKEIHEEQEREKPNESSQLNEFIYSFMTMFKIKEETKEWATRSYKHRATMKLLN